MKRPATPQGYMMPTRNGGLLARVMMTPQPGSIAEMNGKHPEHHALRRRRQALHKTMAMGPHPRMK